MVLINSNSHSMSLKRYALVFLCYLLAFNYVNAQVENETIDPDDFTVEFLEEMVIDGINGFRGENGLDSLLEHHILMQAARNQALYMAEIRRKTTEQKKGKYKTTAKRMEAFGGTANASEMVGNASAGKRKQSYTYGEVRDVLLKALLKSKKNIKILSDGKLFYYGAAIGYDAEKKKCYLSLVVGGVDALNPGKEMRKMLPVKYTKGKKGYKPWSKRDCRKVKKFDNISALHNGIYMSDNKVFIEYDNYKKLSKLLRGKHDGLGIEIVQKEQFQCGRDNIVDNTLTSKGILLKPTKTKKLWKNNLVEDVKSENRYQGMIGKIPNGKLKKLSNDYELNLVVMMNKTYCRSVFRTYLEDGGQESLTRLSIFPDTITSEDPKRYKLSAEQNILDFTIPFDVAKYEYDPDDIKPFIEALDEPKFVIDKININAQSSIEGDSAQNVMLQKKRAESIVNAIRKMESKEIIGEITTSGSWEMFRGQVKGTEFEYMANMSKSQVKAKIAEPGMLKKLEPYLAMQRFASISMGVTYDIEGDNEYPFVLAALRKAIEKNDAQRALRIQKFAIQKAIAGKYDPEPLLKIEIPDEPPFASMKVNQIFLDTYTKKKNKLYPGLTEKFGNLYRVAPENDHVNFNQHLMLVKFSDLADEAMINEMQGKINKLYSSKVPQEIMDALNLEYQFKVIEYADTSEFEETVSPLVEQSLEKIKKIFKIEDATWQNSLKLAYIFMKFGDLDYAYQSLAPFVKEGETLDEELVFAFISIAGHFPEKVYTKEFRVALSQAKELNGDRYCELFSDPYLSFQVLEHPLVKDEYCDFCEGFGE